MYLLGAKRLTILAFAAIIASALTISLTPAYAQKHGGGSSGHGGESSSHSDGDSGCSGCSGDEGGESGHKGSKGGYRGGNNMDRGSRSQSLRDIFHDLDTSSGTDHSGGDECSSGSCAR